MLGHYSVLSESPHSLLEPPSPAYSSVTVRRALVVWLHCGQRNQFRQVCDYYHRLEAMESTLSPEDRATSRLHEFNLLSGYPPTSKFLMELFPKLYCHSKKTSSAKIIKEIKVEEMKLENCVFNLEGFHDMKIQKGTTTKDIIKASQIIRNYCKAYSKSLKVLLTEFQNFAEKTKCTNSVDNITMYIKKKYLKDDLEIWQNMPRSFPFLNDIEEPVINIGPKKELVNNKNPPIAVDHVKNANKNANKIRILVNESRVKEHVNIMPNFAESAIKDKMNGTNVQAVKLTNIRRDKLSPLHYAYDISQ
ncbi:uncharacterized protein LOC124641947 [Helicoverpa zea]|uniref:uncharacterized protein LOC124641947 n=1 Tax=Helicoverpa zea TaxID=7113 RepID=UPI001F561DCD|nr:uncharacterized protein LOC124641947 [Helicoverpa zea]